MRISGPLCPTIFLFLTALLSQAQTARITGTVSTPDKKTAKGVHVLANRVPDAASSSSGRNLHAITDATGTFDFKNLPDGTYSLCLQAPGSDYLDSCRWALPISVKTSAAQPAAPAQLSLQQGIRLSIAISDPAKLISSNEGKTAGANMLVGIWSGNLFFSAPVDTKLATARTHSLVIPKSTSVRASVFSKFYKIGDSKGVPLAKNATVSVPATANPVTIKFTVLGK